MEFKPPKKTRKLDFTRPTFNEPIIQLPPLKEESSKSLNKNWRLIFFMNIFFKF